MRKQGTVSHARHLPVLGTGDAGTFYTVATTKGNTEYEWTGTQWLKRAKPWDYSDEEIQNVRDTMESKQRLPWTPDSKKAPRDQIIETAQSLISGDRQQAYGSAAKEFTRTAKLWEQVLGVEITPEQYALCMVLVKVSRLINTHDHADSWVDVIGYAALGGEIAQRTT